MGSSRNYGTREFHPPQLTGQATTTSVPTRLRLRLCVWGACLGSIRERQVTEIWEQQADRYEHGRFLSANCLSGTCPSTPSSVALHIILPSDDPCPLPLLLAPVSTARTFYPCKSLLPFETHLRELQALPSPPRMRLSALQEVLVLLSHLFVNFWLF